MSNPLEPEEHDGSEQASRTISNLAMLGTLAAMLTPSPEPTHQHRPMAHTPAPGGQP